MNEREECIEYPLDKGKIKSFVQKEYGEMANIIDRLTCLLSEYSGISKSKLTFFLKIFGIDFISKDLIGISDLQEQKLKEIIDFLDKYFEDNLDNNVFKLSGLICLDSTQINNVMELREFRNIYKNLKGCTQKYILNSSLKAGEYFKVFFEGIIRERELFVCAFLDNQNKIISTKIMAYGTCNDCHVSTRELVKEALNFDADNVILAHNHPSGKNSPSKEDIEITRHISYVLNLVNIGVVDHIIVVGDHYISFSQNGILEMKECFIIRYNKITSKYMT